MGKSDKSETNEGGMMEQIRLLSKEYDITSISEVELAATMKQCCETYIMCMYEMSSAMLDARDRVEHVASEIIRRREAGLLIHEGDQYNAPK